MNHRRRDEKRRQKRSRRDRRATLSVIVLTALCGCGILMMAALNAATAGNRHTYTTPGDIWYVDEGSVEVASAQATPTPDPIAIVPEATVQPTAAPEAIVVVAEATAQPVAAPGEKAAAQDDGDAQPRRFQAVAPPTPDPTRAPATITITAAGDCTLGTYTTGSGSRSNFKSYVDKYGYDYFFQNVRELFSQDDLTIVNLEGPLTSHNSKRPRRAFNFRGYPEYVNILSGSSIEICNLANNHALDYQKEGVEDTYKALTEAGIGASGYGPEYYTEVNGYTVGSLGFTEWNFEPEDILSAVQAANEKCDLLIVSMHWGKEHHYEMSSYCRRMGRALIDAGADIVIGTHSHVYGEIEQYKGKYIITSLGNFCFGGNDDPYIQDCVIFRQKFNLTGDGEVTDGGIDIIPALISSTAEYNDFQPKISDPQRGAELLAGIWKISPTLSDGNVLWLEDSYVRRNGLVNDGQTAQAEAPAAPDQAPVAADAAPTMGIAQDVAL